MMNAYIANMSKAEHDELCCSYSALMLHDDNIEITAEKLERLITSSGNTVDAHWPRLFSKALAGADINDMLANASAGAAPAPVAVEPVAKGDQARENEVPDGCDAEPVNLMDLFGDEYGEE